MFWRWWWDLVQGAGIAENQLVLCFYNKKLLNELCTQHGLMSGNLLSPRLLLAGGLVPSGLGTHVWTKLWLLPWWNSSSLDKTGVSFAMIFLKTPDCWWFNAEVRASLGISKSGAGGGRKLWWSVMWPDTAFAATKHSLVFCAPVRLLLAVPILEGCTQPQTFTWSCLPHLKGSCSPFPVLWRESYLKLLEDLSFEAFGSWAKPVSTTAVPWSFSVCGSFGTELYGVCKCSMLLSSLQQSPLRVWLYCIHDFSFPFHQGFAD